MTKSGTNEVLGLLYTYTLNASSARILIRCIGWHEHAICSKVLMCRNDLHEFVLFLIQFKEVSTNSYISSNIHIYIYMVCISWN